jgi:hypothetical protein
MKAIVAIIVLLCVSQAQEEVKPSTVEIKPQIREPWQIPCKEETVQPNLEMKTKQLVSGHLKDPSGAVFENSKVLLRRQDGTGRFVDYRSVVTDKDGRFDLKEVEPGKYRFLPGPNRGWKQPKNVSCSNGSKRDCELNLVIDVNPTDQPFAGCPIQ